MITDFRLPDLGEGLPEAEIVQWHVAQGDQVTLNQTIAAWSYMQRQQCPGRLIVFHKANHWIMRGADARYFWNEVHAWLAQHLAAGR